MAKRLLSGLFFSLYKTVTNISQKKKKGIKRIKKVIAGLEVLFYSELFWGKKSSLVFLFKNSENLGNSNPIFLKNQSPLFVNFRLLNLKD